MSIIVAEEEDIESISSGGDDYTEEGWSISDTAAAQWSIAADDTTAVVDPLLRYVTINNCKKLSIIISFSLIMLFFALLNFIE